MTLFTATVGKGRVQFRSEEVRVIGGMGIMTFLTCHNVRVYAEMLGFKGSFRWQMTLLTQLSRRHCKQFILL